MYSLIKHIDLKVKSNPVGRPIYGGVHIISCTFFTYTNPATYLSEILFVDDQHL